MKTFGKLLAIWIFILFFLALGLYFALNNLGSMLAADHDGLKWKWISSGIQIKTGGRVENIQFKLPVDIHLSNKRWVFQSGRHNVTIYRLPRFRIQWQKVNAPSPKGHSKALSAE